MDDVKAVVHRPLVGCVAIVGFKLVIPHPLGSHRYGITITSILSRLLYTLGTHHTCISIYILEYTSAD